MLLTQLKVTFYPVQGNSCGYNPNMVKSGTFRFFSEMNKIGFFEPVVPIDHIGIYQFNFEYIVNAEFTYINFEIYQKYQKRWGVGNILDILLGSQIIGVAEILEYSFVEDNEKI